MYILRPFMDKVLSEEIVKWVGIFQVGIFWVGIFRGKFSSGEFDGWEFSQGEFSQNHVTQSNYLIIKTKLLTALFKNNIETKEYNKFVETQKFSFEKKDCVEYSKTVRRKKYVD